MSTPVPTFSRVRWREGYQVGDVDDFLLEIRPLLDGRLPDPALADRIVNARFRPVRLRAGYDMMQVDAYLDQLHALASQGHSRI